MQPPAMPLDRIDALSKPFNRKAPAARLIKFKSAVADKRVPAPTLFQIESGRFPPEKKSPGKNLGRQSLRGNPLRNLRKYNVASKEQTSCAEGLH